MIKNDGTALLRADYLRYCRDALWFEVEHKGDGFRNPKYIDNCRAQELVSRYNTLAQRACALDEPKLEGITVLTDEFWESLGYKLI